MAGNGAWARALLFVSSALSDSPPFLCLRQLQWEESAGEEERRHCQTGVCWRCVESEGASEWARWGVSLERCGRTQGGVGCHSLLGSLETNGASSVQ